jgi:O-6-methylguanine DNA methyltransferase
MAKRGYTGNCLVRRVIHHNLTDVTLFATIGKEKPVIVAVAFGAKTTCNGDSVECDSSPSGRLAAWHRKIIRFLDGYRTDLTSLPIDLSKYASFSKKVLRAARKIPYGKTVSYARLAAMSGHPRAVRAAASVMRNNPFPLIIPCHRVIKSDGSIGGFMGKSKGKEVSLKRKLLQREKTAVKGYVAG